MKTKLLIASLTDIGKERHENQDFHAAATGNFGTICVVCDGMGGAGGGLAAQAAAEAVRAHFTCLSGIYNENEELGKALGAAEAEIRNLTLSNPGLMGMGTTALVLLVKEDRAFAAHLGDSRAYLIREESLRQLTKDHSVVQRLIDAGTITAEQAGKHPDRNIITRMLGIEGKNMPEYTDAFSLFKNDVILLCSDGLTRHVSDRQIIEAVKRNSLQDACRILIKLANIGGGEDNITVQLIQVTKGRMLPVKSHRKKIKSFLSIFIPLAALTASVVFFSRIDSPDIRIKEPDSTLTDRIPERVSFSGRASALNPGRESNSGVSQANTLQQNPLQQPVTQKAEVSKSTSAAIKFRISKPGTNVRENPDTHSASVAVLAPGSTIYSSTESRADGESGGALKWHKIKLEENLEGWVRSDRFSVVK